MFGPPARTTQVRYVKEENQRARETVMSYIRALDSNDYDRAATFISDEVRIIGPAGESFGKPRDFTEMLARFKGRYDLQRAFVDEDEVCLLYDYHTSGVTVYMSSWYKVRNGKIEFIRTVFDPSAFRSKDD